MDSDEEDAFDEIIKDFVNVQLVLDAEGVEAARQWVFSPCFDFFIYCCPWFFDMWYSWSEDDQIPETPTRTQKQKEQLRDVLLPIIAILPFAFDDNSMTIRTVTRTRTTVQLLCKDVPELAETLLYCPQMQQNNAVMKSWSLNSPIKDYADYVHFRMNHKRFPNYPWFYYAENITHIGEKTVEESRKSMLDKRNKNFSSR